MAQTQTSGLDPAIAALIPTGNQVYDAIMGKIEPELISANLPGLEAKYAGESLEERQVRMQRYTLAFQEYDRVYGEWITNVQKAVKAKRTDALQKAEIQLQEKDAAALADLEAHFSH